MLVFKMIFSGKWCTQPNLHPKWLEMKISIPIYWFHLHGFFMKKTKATNYNCFFSTKILKKIIKKKQETGRLEHLPADILQQQTLHFITTCKNTISYNTTTLLFVTHDWIGLLLSKLGFAARERIGKNFNGGRKIHFPNLLNLNT